MAAGLLVRCLTATVTALSMTIPLVGKELVLLWFPAVAPMLLISLLPTQEINGPVENERPRRRFGISRQSGSRSVSPANSEKTEHPQRHEYVHTASAFHITTAGRRSVLLVAELEWGYC
jgi:hypothetical protein